MLGMLLIFQGWRPALLTAFLIALIQWLRHIASEVDRIGWVMSQSQPSEEETEDRAYQTRMLVLLFVLIQLLNAGIIYQIYVISTCTWALIGALVILVIEVFFLQIRGVNRRINYKSASYGIKDYSPLAAGASALKHKEIDDKLARLKNMAANGEITQKAYEKVRDRALIDRIMNE